MNHLADRQIWMFREKRSGSTGLTQALCAKLEKTLLYINEKDLVVYDSSVLVNTHTFDLLLEIREEHNPILLRCTRKNKFEQFLSLKMTNLTGFTNINTFDTLEQDADRIIYNKYIKDNRVEITKLEVFNYLRDINRDERLWNQTAFKFPNHIFYYEDLFAPISIPVLGIYDVNIGISGYTKQIPEYKKEFFTNYDMVKEWMDADK
jgi:hypothetical protein